jgi:hypothetical protein
MFVHELTPTEELGLFKTVGDVIHNEFALPRISPRGGLLVDMRALWVALIAVGDCLVAFLATVAKGGQAHKSND